MKVVTQIQFRLVRLVMLGPVLGTATTSALLDTSPNWRAAVNGADATTEATIGDLLIIRANDGSNADDWTLVETGTVTISHHQCWRRSNKRFPSRQPVSRRRLVQH